MLDEVNIIENVVPLEIQDRLERIAFSPNFGWFFNSSSDPDYMAKNPTLPNNAVDIFQFTHRLASSAAIHSDHYPVFAQLISAMPCIVTSLIRMKMNLTTRSIHFNEGNYGVPHIDYPVGDFSNHIIALYYVNDSDGDTIIFNESESSKELTIKERIAPKKGRMVLFNGDLLHASSNPIKNDLRCVVNINFTV